MKTAHCNVCGARHEIDEETYEMFGPTCICIPCTDTAHVDFMQRKAKALGLKCAAGCRCGFGE
jgi:hypothetical protein